MKGTVRLFALVFLLTGCGQNPVERTEWLQMGTVAAVQSRGLVDSGTVAVVREAFTSVETLLNAHEPSSELSTLAEFSDEEVLLRCSRQVRPCYESAFALKRETEGAFNPRWRGPTTLDLGAIAKGFALDEAARRVRAEGPILLDLGGNLKACKGDWRVGIKGGDSFLLREGEACATSAQYYRQGHIRDGRNGEVVKGGAYSVTVVHPESAMMADGLSTVLFILGREEGEKFLRRHHPEAKAIWTN